MVLSRQGPRRRLWIAAALALLLAVTACTGSHSEQHHVVWQNCDQLLTKNRVDTSSYHGRLHVRCVTLQVPLDYRHPAAGSIALHAIELLETANTRPLGSLIVNFGGPGVSGMQYLLGYVPELGPLLQHFDVVSFDPRGVGQSDPLDCVGNAARDALDSAEPDVRTMAGLEAAKALTASYDHACATKYGSRLQFFNTIATARDMDRVRAATGDAQMNYLGFSYGTRLGWVYSRLYPTRMHRAVLDGAGDPTLTTPLAGAEAQLRGFEEAFGEFAAYCREVTSCRAMGDTTAVVLGLRRRTARTPLPAGADRSLTLGLLDIGLTQGLYFRSEWPQLARAIIAAQQGNGAGLIALADEYNGRAANGSYDSSFDAYNVISCNDSPPGPSDATIRSSAIAWAHRFPVFGPLFSEELAVCAQWRTPRTVPPPAAAVSRAEALVIGNLHDPATPYEGAKNLVAALGHAELLTWTGPGHTVYLQGHPCIDHDVERFVVSGTLPTVGTTCRA